MSFNGRLAIDKSVNVGGFRAGGLFVRVRRMSSYTAHSDVDPTFRTSSCSRLFLQSHTKLLSESCASLCLSGSPQTPGRTMAQRATHRAISPFPPIPTIMSRHYRNLPASSEHRGRYWSMGKCTRRPPTSAYVTLVYHVCYFCNLSKNRHPVQTIQSLCFHSEVITEAQFSRGRLVWTKQRLMGWESRF